MRNLLGFPALAACLLAVHHAQAGDLISITGGQDNGLQGIGPGIEDWQYLCSSWTFAQSFANVTYAVAPGTLYAEAGTINTYYLTNAIGPSATAGNVIASGSQTVSTTGWQSTGPVLAPISLGPGTYYLILVPSAQETWNNSWTSRGAIISTAPGVAFAGTLSPAYQANNDPFPPSSTWWISGGSNPPGSGVGNDNLAFTLTGDAVPEPSTVLLVSAGLVGLLSRFRRTGRGASACKRQA